VGSFVKAYNLRELRKCRGHSPLTNQRTLHPLSMSFWNPLEMSLLIRFRSKCKPSDVSIPSNRGSLSGCPAAQMDQELNCFGNYGLQAFEPRSPRKPHRGGTVHFCWSINGQTLLVHRTLCNACSQGLRFGCFSCFFFFSCSCFSVFCFLPFSLSFLPLSPMGTPSFPLSFMFSP
jgi:hypothetical protein